MTEPEQTRDAQAGARRRRRRDRAGRRPPSTATKTPMSREPVFRLEDVTVSYDGKPAVVRGDDGRLPQRDHRPDRALGLRQVDPDPLPQPDERPDPLGERRRQGPLPRRGHLRATEVDPVEVRKRIGMVFQKPNPFPKSIYDNIAFGPRILGMEGDMDEIVEKALRGGALWDEVKDRLDDERVRDVGRPAAAALHRPLPRRRPRRDPDGRALLGARPDLDRQDRGPDARAARAATRS